MEKLCTCESLYHSLSVSGKRNKKKTTKFVILLNVRRYDVYMLKDLMTYAAKWRYNYFSASNFVCNRFNFPLNMPFVLHWWKQLKNFRDLNNSEKRVAITNKSRKNDKGVCKQAKHQTVNTVHSTDVRKMNQYINMKRYNCLS